MSTMDEWTDAVCADLGLDASSADLRAVLDLTRDVAHGVARPAAPLTAYLVGMAVGRGLPLPDAAGRVATLVANWDGPARDLPNRPCGARKAKPSPEHLRVPDMSRYVRLAMPFVSDLGWPFCHPWTMLVGCVVLGGSVTHMPILVTQGVHCTIACVVTRRHSLAVLKMSRD
jgi:hypothetical protein